MVLPTILGGVMKKKKDSDWIVEGLIKKNAINIPNGTSSWTISIAEEASIIFKPV